jgi:hypothetical protein
VEIGLTNFPCASNVKCRILLSKLSLGVIGVALVAILSLGYVGYSALNPQTVTMTQQQQYVTNMQSPQTQTITTVSTVTNQAAVTATASAVNGNAYQEGCVTGVGCNPPYNYDSCSSTGQANNVVCDGYLIQDTNGCVELSVPTMTNQQQPYDHYTLQNLPSSHPAIGSWVVVKGALFQGPNSGPNGTSCPTSYINVSTIAPTNPPPSP